MMSCSKDLLDNISQFCRLYLSDDVESDFIERSLKGLEDVWKLLRDIIEVVTVHNFYVDAELNLLLEELNEIIAKANELAECWHKGMSKIYFVLQFESLASKLQTKLTETCGAISALFRSFGMDSDVETVELCMSKARYITDQQISVIIKDAIQDQMKNALPISEHMSKIEGCLSLSTNQELLLELIALDKIKSEISGDNLAEVEYVDHLIALVTHLHNSYVFKHQVHSINNIPVPVDFCCPLSLELMSDPVIVASGQTYERAFIIRWLDQGFTVCPKTRQSLGHTNLIPNYTVKAWIASWCETNNIKLSDRTKTLNDHEHHISSDHKYLLPKSPEHDGFVMTSRKPPCYSDFPPETEKKSSLLGHSSLSPEDKSSTDKNQLHLHEAKVTSLELLDVDSVGQSSNQLLSSYLAGLKPKGYSRDNSAYNTLDNDEDTGVDGDAVSRMANSPYSSNNASAETKSELPALTTPSKAPEFLSRLSELRVRNQTIWRRASDRFSPRIISSSMDARSDLAGVETQIRKLIEGLKSDSIEEQRNAATELRVLARHNTQNRIVIAHCGAVTHLVSLLYSSDQTVQENAVTALLNLSIDDNNKISIANAEAIDPLIHVLETGNPEAKENAAATLFSLSVNEENKARIGRSGAIVPLVDLLADGTPRGKRDAAIALFNLSIFHENKIRIVQAGAVKHLVELMEPAAGMVDKAVAVLSNLSTIPEGRSAIGYENGIPILVEVVELGSARGKEYAAAALLQLCTNSSRFCNLVLQEGAVPPLVALSQSGTPRGKEKAQLLLSYFRNKRRGNSRGT